jgi:DNA-binding winged helix-turn-helix (wHTH) protein
LRVRSRAFELDEANACLLRDGKAVAVAPTPFACCALARKPGSLLSKHALLDEVWGISSSANDARQPRFIETVSRRGYRFIASAQSVARAGASATRSAQAPSFIGRAEALSRLGRAWEMACSGKRTLVWGRRTGYGQDLADRALRGGSGRGRLCARPVRVSTTF